MFSSGVDLLRYGKFSEHAVCPVLTDGTVVLERSSFLWRKLDRIRVAAWYDLGAYPKFINDPVMRHFAHVFEG